MNMDANCERPRHCGARGTASRSPRLQWLSHRRGCNAVHRACLTPREVMFAPLRVNTASPSSSTTIKPRCPSYFTSTAKSSPAGGRPSVASIGAGACRRFAALLDASTASRLLTQPAGDGCSGGLRRRAVQLSRCTPTCVHGVGCLAGSSATLRTAHCLQR